MEYLQGCMVIAYFVSGRPPTKTLRACLDHLKTEIHEDLLLGRDLGHGFFQLISKYIAGTQKVLMRTLHIPQWGPCIIQS